MPESALGPTGDFPPAYAVFSVSIDQAAQKATDARFVYASGEYGKAVSRTAEWLVGRSYLEIGEGDKDEWLAKCYRAVAQGQMVNGFGYDPLVRDWTCYKFAPSATSGCCVYTIMRMPLDNQQRKQLMATTDARTSLFISEMLSDLAAEQSYDAAMNGMLAKMSEVIHADRLSVFECSGSETTTTFELLANGAKSQLGTTFGLSKEILKRWFKNVTQDNVVLVPNVTIIQRMSEALYQWCVASGVQSLLAAPFFSEGEIVGFLGAYNYQIDQMVDLNRLFEAVSTFVGARIENRQLIDNLRRASSHDTLTDLLNRRGAQQAISQTLSNNPTGRVALAIIDLDDFKRVNDVYGHDVGDEALRAMAQSLREAFPKDAILSRNGGDEFVATLLGDAAANASMLLACFADRGLEFEYKGKQHKLTVSVGYARYPEQASNVRELFTKADAALYAVKIAGKAGFGKYTPDADDHMRLRLGFSARDLLEGTPYSLLITRADERAEILFASSELARLLGYDNVYDLMRVTEGSYAGIINPDELSNVYASIHELAQNKKAGEIGVVDVRAKTKSDGRRMLSILLQYVDIEGSGGVVYMHFDPLT